MPIQQVKQRLLQVAFLAKMGFRLIIRRQLTVKKLINLFQNMFYGALRIPRTTGYPSLIQVDINNICNLKCTACPTGLREQATQTGQMNISSFKNMIDEVKDHVFLIILYNSGEPFLHPDAFELIQYAVSNGVAVMTSSNGHLINSDEKAERLVKAGLDTLIISVSGTTQDIYSKYHVGGECDTVFSNIKRIVNAKNRLHSGTPRIILRYLVFDHNLKDTSKVKGLAKELGVDQYHLRLACKELKFANDSETSAETGYTVNHDDNGNTKNKNHCYWLWMLPVVNYDGNVIPCCHINLSPPVLGNVFNGSSLSEVWSGKKYSDFRRKILHAKNDINACRNCVSFPGFQDKFNEQQEFVIQLSRSRKREKKNIETAKY
ncbi:MAG: SPASM domain-containing protein [Nitrospirae bacterium]|nr:SPASM domain-containing protein [Nitrospirota bacterium]